MIQVINNVYIFVETIKNKTMKHLTPLGQKLVYAIFCSVIIYGLYLTKDINV
ncbi:hypothetical protein UFOVP211_17 [uncultured Caudovirales phage]|uniref:Uncharacterized protein n=1 Tax=uncultured Caudovirales phage TaxID=2100421 RepID=A0A6J7WNZ7_9CAUD|nr:hypothetical protein UFOVP211_17 [uncultured Caudovirales phage]